MEHVLPTQRRDRLRPPAITVYPSGVIAINTAAYRRLGMPRYVSVFIADAFAEIRPSSSADGAFRVSGAGQFGCTRLARVVQHRVWRPGDTRIRLPATVNDAVLRVPLRRSPEAGTVNVGEHRFAVEAGNVHALEH
jgi:hypothetical protein